MIDFYNPYSPMPEPDTMKNLTPEEKQETCEKAALYGCVTYLLALFIALMLCFFLSGCSTPRVIEEHHHHHYEADTAAVHAQVDRQLTSWHEQIQSFVSVAVSQQLAEHQQSEQQHETVTETVTTATDSLGRQLRTEQRTITRDITREQRQLEQRLTRDYEARLQTTVDSINNIWQQRFDALQKHVAQADSSSVHQTPVGDTRPWYRRLWDHIHVIVVVVILAFILWLPRH